MRTARLASLLLGCSLTLSGISCLNAAEPLRRLLDSPGNETRHDSSLIGDTLPAVTLVEDGMPEPGSIGAGILERLPPDAAGLTAFERKARAAILAFYRERNWEPAWTTPKGWTYQAEGALKAFARAGEDGLEVRDYAAPARIRPGSEAAGRIEAEVTLSHTLLTYARHATSGRFEPSRLSHLVTARPPEFDPALVLKETFDARDPEARVIGFNPQHTGYRTLKTALAAARQPAIAAAPPASPAIPSGPPIRLGMADPRVKPLRARLALAEPDTRADVMDAALVAALRSFQEANGLAVNGIATPQTIKALNGETENIPPRAADIIANMERWRWLPRDFGPNHVFVNIPEFLVRVKAGDEVRYEGRVVVGKSQTPTPVFSNEIQFIVVNPSWTVPPSIVKNEYMPLFQRDPEALAKRGIVVTRSRNGHISFRQPPGERNALGRIKFMFPNEHSVYLHDTPSKHFFAQTRRAYSHGCVRVDQPLKFADVLLSREAGLNSSRISGMYGRGERHVQLQHRIPVHLVYFTAVPDGNGNIRFLEDIYGFNARVKMLLGLS